MNQENFALMMLLLVVLVIYVTSSHAGGQPRDTVIDWAPHVPGGSRGGLPQAQP